MTERVDDLTLPCGYCCQWAGEPEDPIPVDSKGKVLERMYKGTHPECEAEVVAYFEEKRRMNDFS